MILFSLHVLEKSKKNKEAKKKYTSLYILFFLYHVYIKIKKETIFACF